MPLAEDQISARYSIQGYDSGEITINTTRYDNSLILSPNEIVSPWPVHSVDELQPANLTDIFELKPEVVLLGTGEKQIFPDIEIMGAFAEKGLGLEIMNTGALCRTFNILVAEDRNVVAAVILK